MHSAHGKFVLNKNSAEWVFFWNRVKGREVVEAIEQK
jgi:hypothetical protein